MHFISSDHKCLQLFCQLNNLYEPERGNNSDNAIDNKGPGKAGRVILAANFLKEGFLI